MTAENIFSLTSFQACRKNHGVAPAHRRDSIRIRHRSAAEKTAGTMNMMILIDGATIREPWSPAEIAPIEIGMAKAVARATDHTIQTVIEIVDVTKTGEVVVADHVVVAVDRHRTNMNQGHRQVDILKDDHPLVVRSSVIHQPPVAITSRKNVAAASAKTFGLFALAGVVAKAKQNLQLEDHIQTEPTSK